MKRRSLLLVATTLAHAACGSADATRPQSSTASDGASATPLASTVASAPAPSSSAAPTSLSSSSAAIDPEVRAALAQYLACKPTDYDCMGKVDLGEFSPLWKKEGALATLLAVIDDPDPRARRVAASQLRISTRFGSTKPGYAWDAAQAGHVIAALEKETDEEAAQALGYDVGCISWSGTGLGDRIQKVYAGARPIARRAILARMMENNASEPKAVALARGALQDSDEKTRLEALDAFDAKGLEKEACDVWLTATTDKNRYYAHRAFYRLTEGLRRCPEKADKVTAAFEASPDPQGEMLMMWCNASTKNASTLKRGATLAERWAKDAEASPAARIDSLKGLVACDAKRGKALAETMAKDSDEYIQREAANLAK